LIGELLLEIEAADDGQSFGISTVGQLDEGTSLYLPTDAVRLLR
jgi:hypothetical protein